MMLKKKDKGDAVQELQRGLNRLGSLLLIDGDFGPSTEAAVIDANVCFKRPPLPEADDALQAQLVAVPDPSPALTAAGLTFIAREEISSPREYRSLYKRPVLPPKDSGVTIGIGYDLRFADRQQIESDWGDVLAADQIEHLVAVSGKAGTQALLATVREIEIPLLEAVRVFIKRMVPKHLRATRAIYPSLDDLAPHQRTALLSLVFNRGNDLDGDRRIEMRRIRDLLSNGKLDQVDEQFEAMTHLWDPAEAPGLIRRRQREAQLWRAGFAALQLA